MAPKNQSREARERLRLYQARQSLHERQRRRRVRDNVFGAGALVLVAVLATGSQLVHASTQDDGAGPSASASASATAVPTPSASATAANTGDVPSKRIAKGATWSGTMTLNKDIRLGIELDGAKAPQATSVEIDLIRKRFYEGTSCHRLADSKGFHFLQCGSANGDGTGDAGFQYGPLENVPSDGRYDAGTIAIARGASPSSQTTQFFIVTGDTTLDPSTGGYTVVGKVTSGLSKLVSRVTSKGIADAGSDGSGKPEVATEITGATIAQEK